jgi:malate synthase
MSSMSPLLESLPRSLSGRVRLLGPAAHLDAAFQRILTPEALAFVLDLVDRFRPTVDRLLEQRAQRQLEFDQRAARGEAILGFRADTANIRESDWTCAPLPRDLLDRRVEITGPVDRKMVINALNSGAKVFMADFEDATSPTWANAVGGQVNLADAVRRDITFQQGAKRYQLEETTATLMVRPRGWHLPEAHVELDARPIPGALFDFGLFFFHNARELVRRGSGPYFYLPKLESHLEARLWNTVFLHAQQRVGLPVGTIKATVLIETLPAAFEMNEILYELREHSAGLNCGRWDYIFSFIKRHRAATSVNLPDRSRVTMDKAFLRAYSRLLIETCHRRDVHAMGGMAAFIPIKDEQKNALAFERVRADKLREVGDGHDGTWVAHPGLVPVAKAIFDEHMPEANQIDKARPACGVTEADLLTLHDGHPTLDGMRHNVRVGIQYVEAWLRGNGCVPLYDLMEDAATAEISRAQVWQWLWHQVDLDTEGGSVKLDGPLYQKVVDEELERIRQEVGDDRFDGGRFPEARALFDLLVMSPRFEEFLTIPAYAKAIAPTH